MLLTRRNLVSILLAAALASCKSSDSNPTTPSSTGSTSIDLTGTWAEGTGGDLTWTLTQNGGAVTGSSRFSQMSGPFLGAVSGQGTISGTVSAGTFSFTDSYTTLSTPNCSLVATGTLTIASSTRMSGRYTDVESCNGATLGTTGGTIDMRKQ